MNATPLQISRGDADQLTPHFRASEFYSTSSDAPPVHPFYLELVDALEYLRNHFGVAWRVTSTFRTESHQRRICEKQGVPFFVDEHMKGRAVDSQPAADAETNARIMREIAADWLTQGTIYQQLRRRGITGFGLYDNFLHLDCRTNNFKAQRRDHWGLVAWWDSRKGLADDAKRFGGQAWTTSPGGEKKKSPSRTSPMTAPGAWPRTRRASSSTASR